MIGCRANQRRIAAINVAMVLGLAPVIGVPMPLFSYGGSALLSTALSIGLLGAMGARRRRG